MNSLNHCYMNLKTIISTCELEEHLDTITLFQMELMLNDICCYLKESSDAHVDKEEYNKLFRKAVAVFTYEYVVKKNRLPSNYDDYVSVALPAS